MSAIIDSEEYGEMQERIRMLNDIALSAVALKITIEHGLPPNLSALTRDLGAYGKRFGGTLEATKRQITGRAKSSKARAKTDTGARAH